MNNNTTVAAWQSGDVKANSIRVHYTRTGGNKPPLVLAHGVTDDGLCWTSVAAALAADVVQRPQAQDPRGADRRAARRHARLVGG